MDVLTRRAISAAGRVLAGMAAVCMATGCVYDVWSWQPCSTDPESCSFNDSGWHTVDDCARSDPLQVELGQGEDDFVPFTPGEVPQLHGGSGSQGGSVFHVWGGARIANPDPAHRRFRLEFHSFSVPGAWDNKQRDSERVAIVGTSMKIEPSGAVSRAGYALFVSSPPSRLTLDVVDECGRTGSAEFVPGPGKAAP